ncbi:MAG: UDP-N-acetylmuramoyl-tripeptide--D-alanyl-D-alanine ligase [Oscillospiraceae bacterium]|jgi:UDP-N-acetylmuramoyl-tripeptide--D-alanyl-D-alanine ligase|nr:UDP-N-acetylmuramoyl-tripeptide--D-alanyl-D-alanine ligase [Oscillospiraceae bacterium]
MTVGEIALAVGGTLNDTKYENQSVGSVCIDSRTIEENCVFVAIKGENFDGHSFVMSAFSAGAVCAICSEEQEDAKGAVILVPDTRAALLRLAAHYREKFSIPVIALTGSVGKTTTKEMVAAVLGSKYKVLATKGNLNNEIGVPRMCFMLGGEDEAAVFELGMSGFGEISALTKTVKPTIGLITNIGVSHIEKLGSREGILRAKLEILDGMDESAVLILNADDKLLADSIKDIKNPVLTYAIEDAHANARAKNVRQTDDGMSFTLCCEGEETEIFVPAAGLHNVYNALAAFLCGKLLSVEPSSAAAGLAGYIPAGMRQKVVRKSGITFIEDCYNASPDSIQAALSVLSSMKGEGRRIAVLGDMMELGDYAKKAHRQCGEMVAAANADLLYALGSNAMYYIDGAGQMANEGRARLYDSKENLVADLISEIKEGDVLLFKASRAMKLEEVIERIYESLDN